MITGVRTFVGRSSLVAVTLGLTAVATSCRGGSGTGFDRPPREGDVLPLVRTVDGVEVPWFEATALESGETVTIESLRGSPVLINLWATWCFPCRAEMPYFQSIYEEYRDRGLRVVGVTVDSRSALDQVHDFLEETGITYEILHDPSMVAMDLFGVVGLPGTFLVTGEGRVTFTRIGPVMEGDPVFEGAVEEVVTASEAPADR